MGGSSWWLSALAVIAAVALMVEAVLWLRRQWLLVNVEGPSMEPTLRDGQEVLARRTRRIGTGQIVVVRAPDPVLGWAEAPPRRRRGRGGPTGPWWVKRVAAGPGEPIPDSSEAVPPGHYFLLSDNPAGDDSRRHGLCPAESIAGVMIRKF
ncbi:S24/S26 family peptidase [Glycomyces xiaoerkulensis]|uniref:S24/S26 family peptidase n=1 Tax=Glycomyces xiaoerkulensis TaxID=2038139 RepID=UPI000C266B58|nr:S24/S26 family peptidase [Glycomyces xiaoerkulensis]